MSDGKKIKEIKRAKYEKKQRLVRQKEMKKSEQESFIRKHAHFCHLLEENALAAIQRDLSSGSDDCCNDDANKDHFLLRELIEPYTDLKNKRNNYNSIKDQRDFDDNEDCNRCTKSHVKLFIAEGAETVRVLIRQSGHSDAIKLRSIMVKPATFWDHPVRLLDDVIASSTTGSASEERERVNNLAHPTKEDIDPQFIPTAPPYHILIGNENALSSIAGFHIARGALACGEVPVCTEKMFWKQVQQAVDCNAQLRIVAMDNVCDTANMGSIIRTSRAFDVNIILLSDDCCDAWSRRAVRVSMGYVCQAIVFRCICLSSTLDKLHREFGLSTYAAVIDSGPQVMKLENIERGQVPRRWCCVLGNEGNGICHDVRIACSQCLCVGMTSGVDSLSVGVAAGIILCGLKEREQNSD
uniref:tRNA/rRNA methyltransferase SpoU type domain-containing protein n=1 Tax=Leptocylindrus danicus TaxID=163516 RepID=A0A7S2KEI5_9STRA|mmetsp:Transcript_21981/g.32968  ORF Transcript_21981/g.32968 Transcript_21981/m.32968 type:complete len:411 (+) Transcript_21981:81-1313(+)